MDNDSMTRKTDLKGKMVIAIISLSQVKFKLAMLEAIHGENGSMNINGCNYLSPWSLLQQERSFFG